MRARWRPWRATGTCLAASLAALGAVRLRGRTMSQPVIKQQGQGRGQNRPRRRWTDVKTLTLEPTRIATSARGPRLFKVPHPSVLCVCVCVCVCVCACSFSLSSLVLRWCRGFFRHLFRALALHGRPRIDGCKKAVGQRFLAFARLVLCAGRSCFDVECRVTARKG